MAGWVGRGGFLSARPGGGGGGGGGMTLGISAVRARWRGGRRYLCGKRTSFRLAANHAPQSPLSLSLSPRLFFLSGCQFSHLATLARDKRLWFGPLRRLESEPFFASCQGAQLPRLALPCPASPRGPEARPPSKLRLLYRIRVGCSLSLVALRSLRCPQPPFSPRTMMAIRHALAT